MRTLLFAVTLIAALVGERDPPFNEIEAYVARWESFLSPTAFRLALMSSANRYQLLN